MAKTAAKLNHEGNAFNRDFIAMTIPLFLMAFFFYGPRVMWLAFAAMLTAHLCDRVAAIMRNRAYDLSENSSITFALLIVLMMPATVGTHIVVVAVMVAVFVGKEAFGGYQSYPFNPAAVGFCVAAVSWPQQIFSYPEPLNWMLQQDVSMTQIFSLWRFEDVAMVEGISMTLRNGGLPKVDFWNLLLGNYAGPMGLGCSLVIMSCAVYLVAKRRISVAAPISYMIAIVLIAFIFPRYTEISMATFPQDFMLRLQVIKFEVLSGAILFSAVFLISEPGTLPKNVISRIIYGVLLGIATMAFRYFGTFELGACFALLTVNALSGYFDRAISGAMARKKEKAVLSEQA